LRDQGNTVIPLSGEPLKLCFGHLSAPRKPSGYCGCARRPAAAHGRLLASCATSASAIAPASMRFRRARLKLRLFWERLLYNTGARLVQPRLENLAGIHDAVGIDGVLDFFHEVQLERRLVPAYFVALGLAQAVLGADRAAKSRDAVVHDQVDGRSLLHEDV